MRLLPSPLPLPLALLPFVLLFDDVERWREVSEVFDAREDLDVFEFFDLMDVFEVTVPPLDTVTALVDRLRDELPPACLFVGFLELTFFSEFLPLEASFDQLFAAGADLLGSFEPRSIN